jgi:hypothetical protein
MNYAIEDGLIVTEDGSVCSYEKIGPMYLIKMYHNKIETEFDDDTISNLSEGRVFLKRMANVTEDETISYCLDWMSAFTDWYEVPFTYLINELNKSNNMNDI